jgi:murein DD-endopeptidase MepM/ murein hydrolase activator NlpD
VINKIEDLSHLWKFTILLALGLFMAISIDQISQLTLANTQAKIALPEAPPPPAPTYKFGFMIDSFTMINDTIQSNQFLSDILMPHKVDLAAIDRIARNAAEVFDVRSLRSNKPFTILNSDTSTMADYFIYQPNAYRYVVYDLKKEQTEVIEHKVEKREISSAGIVESSLWNAMVDNGMSYELTSRMEDALAWSVDFHHIQKGDRFKLVYEQDIIDGKVVGIGDVKAAYYSTSGNDYYAIYFENETHRGYYDLEGRTMEGAFLKAPVKYSRISSRYGRRYHPVLKRTKAHLGTDYAAPRGTPIFTVADGIVVKRSRSRGNGNYVKIKHDKVYQTQYLHMSRFQKGVTVGTHVKQGQTIGYVGSTGLATGPHVCFRFWKNGKQVNHLRENLPPPEPMAKEDLPKFFGIKNLYKAMLDEVPFTDAKKAIIAGIVKMDTTGLKKRNP